MHIGNITLFFY